MNPRVDDEGGARPRMTGFADHPAEQDFKHLAETVPMMVWTTTADGTLDYFSPQWSAFSGLSQDDPDYLNWHLRVHPDDAEAVAEAWGAAVQTEEIYDRDLRMLSADGKYYWINARGVPVLDERGEVSRWYGTCTNIQNQKEWEEKLQRAADEKDHFLAMLAHELRNPLAALITGHELLEQGLGDEERREVQEHHARQLRQLERLVEDTLIISRLNTGKMRIEREEVDFVQLLQGCLHDVSEVVARREIDLSSEIAKEKIWVMGDAVRLSQCVINILNNALKFTPKGGTVSVDLRLDDESDRLKLTVSDSGVGLAEEDLSKIFEIFEQVDSSMAYSRDGLGLGLSVVKSLIEQHEGEVAAESEGLGHGASFSITLPTIHPPLPVKQLEVEKPTKQARCTILLVEDNPSVALMMRLSLTASGHQVFHANSGEEAFTILAEITPQIVFCDLTLPGEYSGWDIAEKLVEQTEVGDRPYLVALSGHTGPEHRLRSLEVGFQEHLAKPASAVRIRECVDAGLRYLAQI